MNKKELDIAKTKAVKHFVNTMIGAFESGFVEKNNPTLSELHRTAQNHCLDNYKIPTKDLVEEWGEEIAKLCGLGQNDKTVKSCQWIDANEIQPNPILGQEAILAHNGECAFQANYKYYEKDGVWMWDRDFTHWMPLEGPN